MNKQELQGAFSKIHASDELIKEVLSVEKEQKKAGFTWRRGLRLAATAAMLVAILIGALAFWSGETDPDEPGIVAVPGVMKVYACEIDSATEEDLEKFAITDKRDGFFVTIHLPAVSATFRMPISFVISENYWGERDIRFQTVSEYAGFFENLTIANGDCVIIDSRKIAESVYAVRDQVGVNGEFYVDILIYADEEIVGYGVLSFCFINGDCYAYEFYTECYPMTDGKMQEITMDNVQERIRTYKQAKVPGEGAEYVRRILEKNEKER